MSESFPCIICGKTLKRVDHDYEAQPYDGVICHTNGNYGSRVFDSLDGSYLSFNICDKCLTEAAEAGRVMISRNSKPAVFDVVFNESGARGPAQWGHYKCNKPFLPWNPNVDYSEDPYVINIETAEAEIKAGNLKLNGRFTYADLLDQHNWNKAHPNPKENNNG